MDSNKPTRECIIHFEENFSNEYGEFCKNFDSLTSNLFNGPKLDQLVKSFLEKHNIYIDELYQKCLEVHELSNGDIKYDTNNNVLSQDLQLVSQPCKQEDPAAGLAPAEWLANLLASGNSRLVLADLYRRASQASHLRVTWNKSRLGQEDDRLEPLDLARRALRLETNNFQVVYWYMIALGWYLDPLTNPRERALVARLFKVTCERCISLNPGQSLAHHLLGRYYFNVAKLTWLERMAAKNLLGCKLDGTFKQAEDCMRRSHQLNPNWLPTGLWMAKLAMVQKRPIKEQEEWIEFGLKCDCFDAASELDRGELLEMRSKLKITN